MSKQTNRRRFLKSTVAVGTGFYVLGRRGTAAALAPNERIAFASVGIGGKGSSDSAHAAQHGDVVAFCDVDEKRLAGAEKRFAKGKPYTDFRKMLEENKDRIDAVTVSTPDHTHAVAALMAMRMGKGCFCQKPMTHSIHEARLMGEVARENKVATQMGNQGTAMSGLREAAALLKAGAIGKPSEVHVWTNRPVWPQGGPRPAESECPESLKWDLWLSRAPVRPYAKGYHPFAWRGYWDFGTGALGDMACHTMNMPFMGLDLRDPISVQAETSGHNKDSYPKWSIINYEFAATDSRPAIKLVWYDGGKRAPKELLEGRKPSGSGCLVVGSKGKLYSPNDYGAAFEMMGGAEKVPVEFPKSPGHFAEWVRAIKGGEPAMSNFPDYAAPLTETVLLGNLAVWVDGDKVEWDAKNLKSTNISGLEEIIKPVPRKGYVL